MMTKNSKLNIIVFFLLIVFTAISAVSFLDMRAPDKIYPSRGVTEIRKLSQYNPNLKDGPADTDIYYFRGSGDGGSMLVLGGTHPNEPSGFIAALILTENIIPLNGDVYIIPQTCLSGFSCTDPMEAQPMKFSFKDSNEARSFRFGSRVSNPLHQWPDPLVYSHYPSGQKLSGFETRNLNRAYPGKAEGNITEMTAFAIVQLIKSENINVAIDLHEAAPEIPIINALVYHEKGEDIALNAVFNLEFEGLKYSPERSPVNFHGLSHREWGDNTNAYAFLMETCNPIQGRLRGITNESLIIEGNSDTYFSAKQSGALRLEYLDEGVPLKLRVGRHIVGINSIIDVYNENNPDESIIISGFPSFEDIIEKGLNFYLLKGEKNEK
ncbi:MAG: hypothetical protein K9G57_02055 [Ignavibacteriales bacterium]|nr:hypothetical protein [Ignavibacteriales bacterium]